MARKLHRDPSSLSRFERGQQLPRDVEQVIAAYVELEPAPAGHTPTHAVRTLVFRVQPQVALLLGMRWVVLALVVTIGVGAGANGTFAADSLRIFVVLSAMLAIALMGVRFRRLQRRTTSSVGGQLIVVSWTLATAFLAQSCARRIGEAELRVDTACWALLAVEIALIGLTWRVEEPLQQVAGASPE